MSWRVWLVNQEKKNRFLLFINMVPDTCCTAAGIFGDRYSPACRLETHWVLKSTVQAGHTFAPEPPSLIPKFR